MYKQHLHLQIAKMLFVQAAGALKVLGAEALPPFLRDGGLGQERLGVGGEDMAGDLKQAIRVAEDASGTALHRADGLHGQNKNLSVLLRAPAFLTGGALARSKSVAKCQGMRRRGSDDREVENKEKKVYLVP